MSKIIALDAGHGYNTAGKRCLKTIDPSQTREWFLNDRIADRLEILLKEYDCAVLRVDDTTGARDISLSNRVSAANKAKAALYLSIHHNAGIGGGTGGGTVVYFYSTSAARYAQARQLYQEVTNCTRLTGNRSAQVQKNGFYVLKHTVMPAFLLENGFMDSASDTPVILTQGHAEKTAQGLLNFLVSQLSLKKKKNSAENPGSASGTNTENPGGPSGSGTDTPSDAAASPGPSGSTAPSPAYPPCGRKYITISTGLASIGVDNTYAHRRKLAAANGITGYMGTAAQNTRMLNLLKAGLLKKA